jgi:hypothetical protein
MREDEAIDLQKHRLLLACRPRAQPVQQFVQSDVIALLPREHAQGAAQLGAVLLCQRPHCRSFGMGAESETLRPLIPK